MTKNEAKILNFIKQSKEDVSRTETLNHFNGNLPDNYGYLQDRMTALLHFGYIKTDPLVDDLFKCDDDPLVQITPLGLHELDEYLENQTRISKLEADTSIAQRNAYITLLISGGSLIVSVMSLLC